VISYAISGIFRNRKVGILIRVLLWRICKLLDRMTSTKYNIDNASCSYFIGRKKFMTDIKRSNDWIAKYYSGSQV